MDGEELYTRECHIRGGLSLYLEEPRPPEKNSGLNLTPFLQGRKVKTSDQIPIPFARVKFRKERGHGKGAVGQKFGIARAEFGHKKSAPGEGIWH